VSDPAERREAPHDYFAEAIASRYDETSAEMFDPAVLDPAVEFLAGLVTNGRALELGVGTGRVALPLIERGIDVHGIDLSTAMIERLRAKPRGDQVSATIGDFSTTRVADGEASFSLVYLVWNTLLNLTSQAAQVACFRTAAWHLASGGRFVVELALPDLRRLPPGERFRPFRVSETRLGFDEYDVANQGLISHHVYFEGDQASRDSTPFRYVWPSELDLMAELADLRPLERWSSWTREPFTSESAKIVAVWEKPTPSPPS
jgi:SAM-dependent methyltransferase